MPRGKKKTDNPLDTVLHLMHKSKLNGRGGRKKDVWVPVPTDVLQEHQKVETTKKSVWLELREYAIDWFLGRDINISMSDLQEFLLQLRTATEGAFHAGLEMGRQPKPKRAYTRRAKGVAKKKPGRRGGRRKVSEAALAS